MNILSSPHSKREEKVYIKIQTSSEHQFNLKIQRKHINKNGTYQANRS